MHATEDSDYGARYDIWSFFFEHQDGDRSYDMEHQINAESSFDIFQAPHQYMP